VGIAGCANSTVGGPTAADTTVDSYIEPAGAACRATPPAASSGAPIDVPPPSAGRPMTLDEKLYRQTCLSGTVQNGYKSYNNDTALRLQGHRSW
jgi:hypothetical protein